MTDVFTFIGCPIMGSPGDATVIRYGDACPVCGSEPPSEIEFLEYSFDFWEGEDIVTAHGAYAVTARLRVILEKAQLKGFQFRKMKASKSKMFKDLDPDHEIRLPEFWELVITGRASAGQSGWWEQKGACEGCGRPLWKHTDRVVEALSSVLKGEIGPPREVKKANWKGDDVFRLDDPGPPLVTKDFAALLEGSSVKGVVFHPAKWV
jgi:hypothetical protein